jgi:hypothetical protein
MFVKSKSCAGRWRPGVIRFPRERAELGQNKKESSFSEEKEAKRLLFHAPRDR